MEKIQLLLPAITAVISATITGLLGYFLGHRGKNHDRFFTLVSDNLEEITGPIMRDLTLIFREEEPKEREELIKLFFTDYLSQKNKIYKFTDARLLSRFYKIEGLFNIFQKSRDIYTWETFWKEFVSFSNFIEDEFWENYNVLYRDFRWYRHNYVQNPWLRIYNYLVSFTYETSKFVGLSAGLLTYLLIYDRLYGLIMSERILTKVATEWILLYIFFGFMLWAFMYAVGSNYLVLTDKHRKGLLRKLIQNKAPRFDKWLVKKLMFEDVYILETTKDVPVFYSGEKVNF